MVMPGHAIQVKWQGEEEEWRVRGGGRDGRTVNGAQDISQHVIAPCARGLRYVAVVHV